MESNEKREGKKSNKVLLILLVVVSLAIGGVVGWVISDMVASKFSTSDVSEKKDKNAVENKTEERELTQKERDDISTKISQIVFLGKLNGLGTGYYVPSDDDQYNGNIFFSDFLQKKNLSDENKALLALNIADGTKTDITTEQKMEETVKSVYKDYFGTDWKDIDVSNLSMCPVYSYDSVNKVYISESACGGITSSSTILHKENYSLSGDEATVDLYLATVRADVNNYPKGYVMSELFPNSPDIDMNKVISPVANIDDYTYKLSNTDKTKANKYRATFKKAADGTFYFSSIDSI